MSALNRKIKRIIAEGGQRSRVAARIEELAREREAKAWDEGYQEANQDLWRDGGREGNPYRKAVQSDA